MIGGLNGVLLFTADVARLRAFYEGVLGLAPHPAGGGAIYDLGGAGLGVFPHSEVQGASRDPYRIMLNLEVDDVEAAHRALVARGVRFLKGPTLEAWGGRMATFADPDGNLLQLVGPVERPPVGQRPRRALRLRAGG